jgi:hypothetical protein
VTVSRYTHKTSSYITSSYITSSYKTSSYKTSIYQTSSYRMSRLQNVQVTKRPFYKTSRLQNVQDTKRPVFVNLRSCLNKPFSHNTYIIHNCILYALHALRPASSKVVVELGALWTPSLSQLCGRDTHALCSPWVCADFRLG